MSPFLRWGIFAIVAVAALWYAYHASKDVTDRRVPASPPVAVGGVTAQLPPVSAVCQVELNVAQNARAARANGDPLDRVLRMQEIAFEDDAARRDRLSGIAQRWFQMEGEIDPTMMRSSVTSECEQIVQAQAEAQAQAPAPAPAPMPAPAPVTPP